MFETVDAFQASLNALTKRNEVSFKAAFERQKQLTKPQYPWVYSHEEGGWLYFNASGSKLMVYSANDQVWREMSK